MDVLLSTALTLLIAALALWLAQEGRSDPETHGAFALRTLVVTVAVLLVLLVLVREGLIVRDLLVPHQGP